MTDNNPPQDSRGRFVKGNTAHKTSLQVRKDKARKDVKAYFKRNSMRAARAIVAIATDAEASVSERLKAAQYIIDRVEGKPETLTGTAGGMFQGAQIVVHTGFQDAPTPLDAPAVDSTATVVNGHAESDVAPDSE